MNKQNTNSPLDKSSRLVAINLVILVIYTGGAFANGEPVMAFPISLIHAGIIFTIGVVMLLSQENKAIGGLLIMSSFIVAIIGFSVCLGNFRLH